MCRVLNFEPFNHVANELSRQCCTWLDFLATQHQLRKSQLTWLSPWSVLIWMFACLRDSMRTWAHSRFGELIFCCYHSAKKHRVIILPEVSTVWSWGLQFLGFGVATITTHAITPWLQGMARRPKDHFVTTVKIHILIVPDNFFGIFYVKFKKSKIRIF
jgi:hypothetical protein